LKIGAHVSVAASYERAAAHAFEIGADTMQIFTSSPRSWRCSAPIPGQAARFLDARQRLGISPLVVHGGYLINLASADPVIRGKSVAACRGEIERALLLEADYLVVHPGSAKGRPAEQAIEAVAAGIAEATRGLEPRRLTLLLENTAGQGGALGSRLEELTSIRSLAAPQTSLEIAYCLDTAHCFAAGLDFLDSLTSLGPLLVPVIHANDSRTPFGSRVDRHEQIGRGYIGEKAFRRILTHPALATKAFILETPVEEDGDDARNIETLKRLCRKSRTTRTRSNQSG